MPRRLSELTETDKEEIFDYFIRNGPSYQSLEAHFNLSPGATQKLITKRMSQLITKNKQNEQIKP
jgi:hypothetical protein